MIHMVCQVAAPGTQFGPDAFNDKIGQQMPVTIGRVTLLGTLLAAEVAKDGQAAWLDVDVPGVNLMDLKGALT
jgi:hypothetical protein